jgi:DNA-binding MarR family transcriptional regulator
MKKEPSEAAVRAWARLLRAQHAALSRVERAFKDAGLPALSWYDVLLELERAGREGQGKEGLRPYELERHLLLPQYGLSRLLDRIEAAGYLKRRTCEEDGRGQQVVITRAGRELRRRMWPVYAGALNEAVTDRLSERDAVTLARLLGKLIPEPES